MGQLDCLVALHGRLEEFGELFENRRSVLADIDLAVQAVERAGGTILRQGEFCPGEPYVFFHDLDGYEVEIWYELPTPLDPANEIVRAASLSCF